MSLQDDGCIQSMAWLEAPLQIRVSASSLSKSALTFSMDLGFRRAWLHCGSLPSFGWFGVWRAAPPVMWTKYSNKCTSSIWLLRSVELRFGRSLCGLRWKCQGGFEKWNPQVVWDPEPQLQVVECLTCTNSPCAQRPSGPIV